MPLGFYAYVHAKPNGVPFYVGKGHGRRATAKLTSRNQHHRNIVSKFGADNILVGTIPCSSEEIAFDLERGMIKCFRRAGVELANYTDGGEGCSGRKLSEETKRKIGAKTKGVVPSLDVREARRVRLLGTKLSTETKAKMRDAHTRRLPDSEETKSKKSAAAKGKPKSELHRAAIGLAFKGKSQTEEHRAKNSAAITAWWAKRKGGTQNS